VDDVGVANVLFKYALADERKRNEFDTLNPPPPRPTRMEVVVITSDPAQ
jgi:hypothetical protein